MEIFGIDVHIVFSIVIILCLLLYILARRKINLKKEIENKIALDSYIEKVNFRSNFKSELIDRINEISRIDNLKELFASGLDHLEDFFEFDYASINVVPFNRSAYSDLEPYKENIRLNYMTGFCREDSIAECWRESSTYFVHDKEQKDILLEMYRKKIKESILVIRNEIHAAPFDLTGNNLNPNIKDKAFIYNQLDKNGNLVEEEFTHRDLARVFVPILYRNSYKGDRKENSNDTCLGVIEVGLKLNSDLSGDALNQLVKDKFSDDVIDNLFIYIDNFAQLLYKNTIIKTQAQFRDWFAKSKVSDNDFLLSCLEYIKKDFGLSYGNISSFDISKRIQNLDKNRDVYCNNYSSIDLEKIDKINYDIQNRGNSIKLGICNQVVFKFSEWRKLDSNDQKNNLCVYLENDITKENTHSIPLNDSVKSEIGIAILTPENNLIGICVLSSTQVHFFIEYHVRILSYFGKLLGTRYLTSKRYTSISRLSEPLNLFEESDITSRLLRAVQKYFGTDDVIFWNLKNEEFTPCVNTHPNLEAGILKIDPKMSFRSEDFMGLQINLEYPKDSDKPILVRSMDEIPSKSFKKHGKGFKKVLIARFISNRKYDKLVTIFSKRSLEQDAVNEFADEFILALRERFQDAFQIHSLFNLLMNYKSDNSKDFYHLIANEIAKYTRADVVGLIPVIKNEKLDKENAVVLGELWNNSNKQSFNLSKLILKHGSNEFSSQLEILEYYENHNQKIETGDFAEKINSIYGLRLGINTEKGKEIIAILMIEYIEEYKNRDGANFVSYLSTMKKVLAEILWSFSQINSDFERLKNSIIHMQKSEEENKLSILKLAEEKESLKSLLDELEIRIAGTSFFEISRIIHHEIFNFLDDIDRLLRQMKGPLSGKARYGKTISALGGIKDFIHDLIKMTNILDDNRSFVNIGREVKRIVKFQEKNRGEIDIEYDLNIPADFEVKWNEAEFKMILYNLISNGAYELEKMKKSGAKIEIKAEYQEDYFEISIRDNGPGISNDKKERIFERGYTTKKGDKNINVESNAIGHGIGLNFVKSALEKKDDPFLEGVASIEVDSKLGDYTCFTIKINQRINNI